MLQVDVVLVLLVRSSLGCFCCCSWNWRKQMYYSIDGYWNDSFQIKTNFCRMLGHDQIEVKTTLTDEIIPLQRRPVVCLTIFTGRCLSIKHETINMIQHVCHPSISLWRCLFQNATSHCPTAPVPPLAACPFAEVTGVCDGLCVRHMTHLILVDGTALCWLDLGCIFPKEHINGDPFTGSYPV